MKASLKLYEEGKLRLTSKYVSGLTPALAFEQSESLAQIISKNSDDFATAIVTKLFKESLMFVKHDLDTGNLIGFAEMFIAQNENIKLDELILILRKGINGDYGKTYGKFDFSVLNNWRTIYESGEKADYLEHKHQKRAFGSTERTSVQGITAGDTLRKNINRLNNNQ